VLTPDDEVRDSPLRQLSGVAELVDACGGDLHVRAEADPQRVASTWAYAGESYGWVIPSRRTEGRAHLTTYGPGPATIALLGALDALPGSNLGSVTLPRDADQHLPASYSLSPRNDWEWFVTLTPPPAQPGEDQVDWLPDEAAGEIADLLQAWSPRHDADPGAPGVLRWCGIRDPAGRLVATAAHTQRVPGVPYLASIATAGDVRGHGYGAAVTAWITRAILADGAGWVTLGMYSDNDIARRLYLRLGYRCDHRFTSGALVRR
jgi:ribosomal protein S18 acetylase RimI-like enzyme